jgi:hypothetical protein
MEPFDWDIGPKSDRWTSEAVARRLSHSPVTSDGAAELGRSADEQLAQLARMLEHLSLEQVVRVGKREDWHAALAALDMPRGATGNSTRTR